MKNRAPPMPKPPRGLTQEARRFWQVIAGRYRLSAGQLKLLVLLCETIDRRRQSQALIKKHGLSYVDKAGQPKLRPEVLAERDATREIARLIGQMRIDVDENVP